MTKQIYIITTGETGNTQGHSRRTLSICDRTAIATAKRDCAAYKGDGWWRVSRETGEPVRNGGRK